jgi:hypothetical protein
VGDTGLLRSGYDAVASVRLRLCEQRVRHRLVDLFDAHVIRPAGAVAPDLLDKHAHPALRIEPHEVRVRGFDRGLLRRSSLLSEPVSAVTMARAPSAAASRISASSVLPNPTSVT